MKLWVDDVRVPPEGWTWAKSFEEAVVFFSDRSREITDASLDHDLGFKVVDPDLVVDWYHTNVPVSMAYNDNSPTGYDLLKWMVNNKAWPTLSLSVHSMNPVGASNMAGVIEKYGPYVYREQFSYINDDDFELKAFRYTKDNI